MKTHEMKTDASSLSGNLRFGKAVKVWLVALTLTALMFFSPNVTLAHCDTMDGPVVIDARKAIDNNNINFVLKWVRAQDESEIKAAFDLMMKVRGLGYDAKELSEKYFFETLVRIHRMGEGVPFTGVKPTGTPIDERIKAADKSIELGNLSPLNGLVEKDKIDELTKRFNKAMALKNFDVNNIEAGREYIEAYVQFFHFAEGEAEEVHAHGHGSAVDHMTHLPWILSGLLFITTIIFGTITFRKR